MQCIPFQSRNRGSFDFKFTITQHNQRISVRSLADGFQSRNRGSFDFKLSKAFEKVSDLMRFQSRNRGSFDFKNNESLPVYM